MGNPDGTSLKTHFDAGGDNHFRNTRPGWHVFIPSPAPSAVPPPWPAPPWQVGSANPAPLRAPELRFQFVSLAGPRFTRRWFSSLFLVMHI